MIVRLFLLVALASAAKAAIANIQVLGSTNVQALLTYQSPVDSACKIEVSEQSNFRPLVHDVNPILFPDADSDGRDPALPDGRNRIFVVGKRAVDQAADGKWYSRSLQTDTLHYYRIRCAGDTATGTFRTANIPVGITYPWPIPQDPQDGNFRWPSVDGNDRNQTIIDPNYGTLIRRITLPGDFPGEVNFPKKSFTKAKGANWSDPSASLADDRSASTYSGVTKDWLILTDPGIELSPAYVFGAPIDSIIVRIKGSAQARLARDRVIDVCLTIDGATCHGESRTVTLDTNETVKTLGNTTPIDTWGKPLWIHDINGRDNGNDYFGRGNKAFGVMIRAGGVEPGVISIQHVEIDVQFSEHTGETPSSCAPVKSNGGFHCAYQGSGGNGALNMYWIEPVNGEVRLLGKFIATGWGGPAVYCNTGGGNGLWDSADPNVFYCQGTLKDQPVLLKGTYTGSDAASPSGKPVAMNWVNLTPDGIGNLIKAFNPDFDPTKYRCDIVDASNQYAKFQCLLRGQNSLGWLAIFSLGNKQPMGSGGTGRVVAAAKTFASPNTRWCGLHSPIAVTPRDWFGWSPIPVYGHEVTLQSPLPASNGTMTVKVSGEPVPYVMDAAVGDLFQIAGTSRFDYVRIIRKNSPTEWVVERKAVFSDPAATAGGNKLAASCNAFSLDDPTVGPTVYWNFLEDPLAQDATSRTWVVEGFLKGSHLAQSGNYRVQSGYDVVTPGIPMSLNHPITYRIPQNPTWTGVRLGTNSNVPLLGNIYQSHPTYDNFRATQPGRGNWFIDIIPFIGDRTLTSSVTPVPNFRQVYRAGGVQLHRDLVPTVARCGGRQLKDISPGPITDQHAYSYCVGSACAAGASAADVFVSCPAPVSPASSCTGTSSDASGDAASVCVADLAPYGQSITQFFFDPSGHRNRVLTNGLMAFHSPRTQMLFDNASALPDGSWVVFPSFANNARRDMYMVKVPPQPRFDSDPAKGSQMVSATVAVTPPIQGVEQILLRYGATTALGNSTSPQSCRSGNTCSITVKARPLELLYSKATFRNSAGQAIAEGPIQAQVTSGNVGAGLDKPKITGSVLNSASFDPKLAPGALVSIFGENLASCEAKAETFSLPTELCDSTVTFNGLAARYFYANPNQLTVVLPSSIAPQQDLTVVVDRRNLESDPVSIPGSSVYTVAPAIYYYHLDSRTQRALIENSDASLNGPERPDLNLRPLHGGEKAIIYANSLGPTDPFIPDGDRAPSIPPARTTFPVEVQINNVPQPVLSAGLAAGLAGIYQITFTLDPATPVGSEDQNFVWLTVNGTESPHLFLSLAPPSFLKRVERVPDR